MRASKTLLYRFDRCRIWRLARCLKPSTPREPISVRKCFLPTVMSSVTLMIPQDGSWELPDFARSEAWAQFVSEWDTICDEEDVPKPFHMVDFVHQKQDFKSGWESEDKRLRVLDRLLCAIEKIQAMPIGAAVVLDGFRNLGDSQRERLRPLTSSRFDR